MPAFQITNQKDLRAAFWDAHPKLSLSRRANKKQNDYPADIRMAWCDYVEYMHRDGNISDALANRATL